MPRDAATVPRKDLRPMILRTAGTLLIGAADVREELRGTAGGLLEELGAVQSLKALAQDMTSMARALLQLVTDDESM